MADRMVFCKKLQREAPGLDVPPSDDELGQEIYNNISRDAWTEWTEQMMVRVINEYRLNLADPEHFQSLVDEMRVFLNLSPSS